MVDMGAEVGQKMRSAIKAKLTELDCYVDDELPDYIMVMVANKRTKTQMNEDLSLFLKKKTCPFVDWLYLVLKKLKEVTVTNLDVYKRANKRKSNESDCEFNHKKIKKESPMLLNETFVKPESKYMGNESLTDDLPLNVNLKSMADNRKIILVGDSSQNNNNQRLNIPSLSVVSQSTLKELKDIESQMRNVKGRLGLKIDEQVNESDLRKIVENSIKKTGDEDASKNDDADENSQTILKKTRKQGLSKSNNMDESDRNDQVLKSRKEHSKIIFSKEDFRSSSLSPPKKRSVLERLGKYDDKNRKSVKSRLGNYTFEKETYKSDSKSNISTQNPSFVSDELSEEAELHNNTKDKKSPNAQNELCSENGKDLRNQLSVGEPLVSTKKDIKKSLGLSSKITIPKISSELLEDTFKKREVVSVVKVKPRVLPPNVQQANKNLLLKAVADAQKSIAQSKAVRKDHNVDTAKYFTNSEVPLQATTHIPTVHKSQRRITLEGKSKLKQFLHCKSQKSFDQEYIPTPIQKTNTRVEYFPSSIEQNFEENYEAKESKQKFVVTLDGIQKSDMILRLSSEESVYKKRAPSPIIFDAESSPTKIERKIPEELPVISTFLSKKKEKCKYFPSCKIGDKCEYLHPVKMCEQFPYCKFGDKCLFIHPNCKFGTSCTKRDCFYVHSGAYGIKGSIAATPVKQQIPKVQICKYFPQCMNSNCIFFHPKHCKFGMYCKNQSDCVYIHTNFPNRKNLVWMSK